MATLLLPQSRPSTRGDAGPGEGGCLFGCRVVRQPLEHFDQIGFGFEALGAAVGKQGVEEGVLGSDFEAAKEHPVSDLESALACLETIAREFAITRGPQGELIWGGREWIEVAPVKLQAVDTVGAGDMFAGAFLYGWTEGWGQRRAGDLACAAAARLVTTLGPLIPSAETREILRRLV